MPRSRSTAWGVSGSVAPLALWSAVALRMLLARGDAGAAGALLDDLWRRKGARSPGCPGAALLCVAASCAHAAGRHAEARHDFLAAAERIAWLSLREPRGPRWRTGLARCEAALGNDEEARRLAAEAVRLAREAGGARGIGITLRVQGSSPAATRESSCCARRSRRSCRHAGADSSTPQALVELGAALRRANFRREAREPLREALELAHRCGAAAAGRARPHRAGGDRRAPAQGGLHRGRVADPERAARRPHGRRGNDQPRDRPGLTVTAKTVETHLRHVFQKLDVERRTELQRRSTASRRDRGNDDAHTLAA